MADERYVVHKEVHRKTIKAYGGWETIKVAWATREDGEEGLLFQHWNFPLNKSRDPHKKGASFFVKTRDVSALLGGLQQLLDHPLLVERFQATAFESELLKIEKQIRQQSELEIDRLKHELIKQDRSIALLRERLDAVSRQRQRIRVIEMEKRLPEFKEALGKFGKLVDEGMDIARTRGVQQESLYQEFLEQHFWMFGLEYVDARPKRPEDVGNVPDLLLQRSDGFNDMVELENPTDPVFVHIESEKRRPELSAELKEALAQTMDYLDAYAVRHRDDFYKDGLETYKPKGIIVIGREGDRDLRRRRRQLNSYFHGIEIWTYDDLVANARRIINLLESGPTREEEGPLSSPQAAHQASEGTEGLP